MQAQLGQEWALLPQTGATPAFLGPHKNGLCTCSGPMVSVPGKPSFPLL